MEKRFCLNCGTPLIGRSDKRFCDDGCRNAHNNKVNSVPNNFVRHINQILNRNRRILQELLGEDKKRRISRKQLMRKGLNFEFYTNQFNDDKGHVHFYVYEFGYVSLDEERMVLVRHQG